MLAYLLMIAIGTTNVVVPNIATLDDCEKLADRMKQTASSPTPTHRCLDYKSAVPARPEPPLPWEPGQPVH
ncbi:hypothetical protein BSZ19_00465 [Bradyrhizobium japonicum]|uniref:Uncharacterized protein n=1 Tax=Bradyrhizobium japonicum TaxID=375 RepID=A0A1Y2JZK3_BRAJP|nr:hypothetical protein BSZ19_00465 [Bradyrhizobium japonicum]